ncbi:bacterial regulatory protein, tetR family [mine drainage metagenome]|uniref:Bacterial regulatory protein, tetR family n=1 Tax=mine drainage metagenome TaxID=410659 RepID=A0A1J5QVT0_9ZZZZ
MTGTDPGLPDAPEARRGPGRPRDPDLEARALEATLAVFGEKGWTGLTIEEVSSRAKVGKSSIYLRWKDKATLLAAALRHSQQEPEVDGAAAEAAGRGEAPDAGRPDTAVAKATDPAHPVAGPSDPPVVQTLREYLVAHATRRANLYLGPHGLAMLRLYVEARAYPDVFAEIRREAITEFVLEERHRVAAAIRAGDLAADASPVQILDAVEGAIFMHILVTPPHLVDRVRRNLPDYITTMVDNQLRAASPVSPRGT